ncbi:putative mrna-associated protein rap55 [Balamuthia mandrillaris]
MSSIPFIGSRISLISKSGIRYEGILYTIDTKESTVALQNVRSFGTEGRRKDGQQIPPSPNVYEFIIFRGSDIKDLQVCEPPPPMPVQTPPNDPAIINVSQGQQMPQHSLYSGYPGQMHPMYAQYPYPMYGSYFGAFPPQQMPGGAPSQQQQQHHGPGGQQPHPQQTSQVPPSHPAAPSPKTGEAPGQEKRAEAQADAASEPTQKPSEDQKAPQQPTPQPSSQSSTETATPQQPAPTEAQQSAPSTSNIPAPSSSTSSGTPTLAEVVGGTAAPTSNGNGNSGARSKQQRPVHTGSQQGGRSQPQQGHQPQGGERRGGPSSRGKRGGGGSRYSGSGGMKIPLDEFDFEKANSLFDKEKLKEEVLQQSTSGEEEQAEEKPLPGKSYDKSTSFFDSLSCDSMDKMREQEEGGSKSRRSSYAEQRRLNAETFGQASVHRSQRGRGRRYHSGGNPGNRRGHSSGAANGGNYASSTNPSASAGSSTGGQRGQSKKVYTPVQTAPGSSGAGSSAGATAATKTSA